MQIAIFCYLWLYMEAERIRYLNGLRGILAIVVFFHHFLYTYYPELVFGGNFNDFLAGKWTICRFFAYTPLNLLFNPGMAIGFFFLLSGYVQSYHYVKTEDITFLQRSFIKRYFRLVIPILFVVVLVFIFHKLHLIRKYSIPVNPLSEAWSKSMLQDNLGFLAMIKYAVIDCFNGGAGYYQVLWTMSPELYNSWMVIILLLVLHKTKNKIPLLLAWAAAELFLMQSFYALSFTCGLILCLLHNQSPVFSRLFSNPIAKTICLPVGLYFTSYPFTGYQGGIEKSIYAPICFFDVYPHVVSYLFGNLLLFLFLLYSSKTQAFLSRRLFLFFGEISFMFYLLHFLILFSFTAWLYQLLLPHLIAQANLWVCGIASFALITLLSYLFTLWIDRPAIRLTATYTKKIFGLGHKAE